MTPKTVGRRPKVMVSLKARRMHYTDKMIIQVQHPTTLRNPLRLVRGFYFRGNTRQSIILNSLDLAPTPPKESKPVVLRLGGLKGTANSISIAIK